MNIYFFLPFIISLGLFFLSFFVLLKNVGKSLNRIFFFLSLSTSIWLFSYSFAYLVNRKDIAYTWFKVGYSGVAFIGISGLYCTVEILNSLGLLNFKKIKPYIIAAYFASCVFSLLIWKTDYIIKGVDKFFWGYYPLAGISHPLFLIFFVGSVSLACALLVWFLFSQKRKISSLGRTQIKYVLLAFIIYSSASIDFLPNYGIEIYP